MKYSESEYVNAGFKFEQAKSPPASMARAYAIRAMLASEPLEDQEEARRLVEQGRQEARR